MNKIFKKKPIYWLHFRAVKFGRRTEQAHLSSTWTWFLHQAFPQLSPLLTASLVSILPANNECSDWIVKSRTWASIPVVITGWVITLAEAHLYLTVAVALKQISFAHRRFLSLKVTELLAQNQASRGAAELWHQLTMKTLAAVIFVEDCRTKTLCFCTFCCCLQLLLWVPIMWILFIFISFGSTLVQLVHYIYEKGKRLD